MKSIQIKSSLYDYEVVFTNDFTSVTFGKSTELAYIIDRNIYNLYAPCFKGVQESHIFLMDAVENEKNMDTVMNMIEFFHGLSVKKNWKVVCFGGGITQDVTTIACNLYLRNIDWYFVPTTLLSMCDSCIGGKCGINYKHIKNQIGVFYPPKKIYIDTHFLSTLKDADYINGWGEIVKFSLTKDNIFFKELLEEKSFIPCGNIEKYICQGLLVKKAIIEQDEFESDLRRVLNYGHTFGHALEAYTNNDIPHGMGVLWGMDVVNYIAYREGKISLDYYKQIKSFICDNFLKSEIVIENADRLFDLVKTDKKVQNNTISLALLDGSSHLIVYPMELGGLLRGYFVDYLEETHDYYCN